MPDLNAIIVDRVESLEPSFERPSSAFLEKAPEWISVRFSRGEIARISRSDPRAPVFAELLDDLRDDGEPAFVLVDPETRSIEKLLLPLRTTVVDLSQNTAGDIFVELRDSHIRHVLRRHHPDFFDLSQALENALKTGDAVIVTKAENQYDIIDVRHDA